MTLTLSEEQIVALHAALLRAFGGRAGPLDRGALQAAVGRPGATFDGEDLYPDPAAKAAVLMHSLIVNHPFLDGNKRVGVAAAELFLNVNGWILRGSDEELVAVTLAVARGDVPAAELAIWLRQRLVCEEP